MSYYVKIPLRHLSRPEALNVPVEQQQELWAHRVENLLADLRAGYIPGWATSHDDLMALTISEDKEQGS
jgi:hypothetical protein